MDAACVVETATGRVAGHGATASGTRLVRFLGVPYAAPPLGDRRFRAPEPALPWPGLRRADRFGPAAPQSAGPQSRLPSFAARPTAEDCLTLNVWTPDPRGARPVMVWFHGGAYLNGGSGMAVFDAARLAAEGDVVVVSVNSRLGALGYLWFDARHDDAVANCGLRDQIAALAWVAEHARAFGGDPARVTAFGESSGAGSVLHLCASHPRPGIRRAIVQSGEPRVLTPERAARVRAVLAQTLDVPDDVRLAERLRAIPPDAIVAAQGPVFAELGAATGLMPFHPTLDDDVVELHPITAFAAGRATRVDLVIGTTRDELRLFPDPRADDLDDDALVAMLGRLAGPTADPRALLAIYRADDPRRSSASVWEAARTDAVLRVPALSVADAHTGAGGRTFVYRFDWEAPGIGAAHAVDVPFTFGTFDRDGWGGAVGYDAGAEALSMNLRNAWCAFARDGDPSHPGIGAWPIHDVTARPTMCFARDTRVVDDPDGAARAAWQALARG